MVEVLPDPVDVAIQLEWLEGIGAEYLDRSADALVDGNYEDAKSHMVRAGRLLVVCATLREGDAS